MIFPSGALIPLGALSRLGEPLLHFPGQIKVRRNFPIDLGDLPRNARLIRIILVRREEIRAFIIPVAPLLANDALRAKPL